MRARSAATTELTLLVPPCTAGVTRALVAGLDRACPAALGLALAAVLLSGCYLSHERQTPCDGGSVCGACVEGPCRHETGEGCGEGEACHVRPADPTMSRLVTYCLPSRFRPVGGPCTGNAGCASGLSCLLSLADGTGLGFCTPHCCGDTGCPTGMDCVPTHVGDPELDAGLGPTLALVGVCVWPLHYCDPLRQLGCDPGSACYLVPTPACLPPGTLELGAACEAPADCAPELACVAEEDGRTLCHRTCNRDDDCGAGQRCAAQASFPGVCRD